MFPLRNLVQDRLQLKTWHNMQTYHIHRATIKVSTPPMHTFEAEMLAIMHEPKVMYAYDQVAACEPWFWKVACAATRLIVVSDVFCRPRTWSCMGTTHYA